MGERVFDGLKVIDCASFIAGPAAATVMSDFGAEVIKIEPPAHRRGIVGDEHVGVGDQPAQHGLSRWQAEIERQALLVAPVEHKARIARQPRPDGWGRASTVGVAGPRRLDLDHLGAEIRHHRRCCRPGDKARAVDHLQPIEDALGHRRSLGQTASRNTSPSRTTWPAVRPAKCVPMTRVGVPARRVNICSRVRRARRGSESAVEDHSGRAI